MLDFGHFGSYEVSARKTPIPHSLGFIHNTGEFMNRKLRFLIGGISGIGIGFGMHELLPLSNETHKRQPVQGKAKVITDNDVLESIKKC
jgi:hypothetical protein